MSATIDDGLFRVDGLVALITGGGTGIGLMIAKTLAIHGAHKVYISGRRKDILEEAAQQSPHDNIVPIAADVSIKADIESLAEKIRKDVGYLNLVIANAGTWGPGPGLRLGASLKELQAEAMKVTFEDWDGCFRVNVHHCYFTTMAVLDLLDEGNKRRNYFEGKVSSQVIFTGSVGGFSRVVGGRNAYRSSKAAVTHLAKCLSSDFQEYAIRVNTLAPGFFPSEMAAELIKSYEKESLVANGKLDRRRIPEGRIGTEDEMAGTLLYLASRAGGYNNGSVCVVDGGLLSVMPATY